MSVLLVLAIVVAVAWWKTGGYQALARAGGALGAEGAVTARLASQVTTGVGTHEMTLLSGRRPTAGDLQQARTRLVAALKAEGYTIAYPKTTEAAARVGLLGPDDAWVAQRGTTIYVYRGISVKLGAAEESRVLSDLAEHAAAASLGYRAGTTDMHQRVQIAGAQNAILHKLGFNATGLAAGQVRAAAAAGHGVGGATGRTARIERAGELINQHAGSIVRGAQRINQHIAAPGRHAPSVRRGGRPSGAATAAPYRNAGRVRRPATSRAASQPGRKPGRPPGSKNKHPHAPTPRPRGRRSGSTDTYARRRATRQERAAGYSRAKQPPKGYQKP